MDILVINLMRLGDLAQTSPVLRRLRAEYPGSRLHLLVMDLFAEAAGMLPGVDRLLTFPSAALAASLDQERGWPQAVGQLGAWLAESFPRPPHLVVNLTPNRLAGILAFATGAPDIRGMAVDETWEMFTQPSWASYALVVSRARAANPFNLVDLFLREAGLRPDGSGLELTVPPEAAREAEERLAALPLTPDTALVGLVPGASRPERSWPPGQFAQAARLLLQARPCHFLIFGSQGEAPLGEAIARELPPGTTTLLLGRTAIPVLTALLQRLHLLITNDTGPMHLAAAVGTRVVALFLASARVQDTGPVGPGHLVVEPNLSCHPCLAPCPQPHCHHLITPAVVAALADHLAAHRPGMLLPDRQGWETCRVHQAATDPLGYHTFLPLVRRPLLRADFWLWVHRLAWGRVLDVSEEGLLGPWVREIMTRCYTPGSGDLGVEEGRSSLAELCRAAARGAALAAQVLELSETTGSYPVRLWQKTEALRTVDPVLRRLAVAFPPLASLVEFFFQEQQRVHDQEVGPLARKLAAAYQRLETLGRITRECLDDLENFWCGLEPGRVLPESARYLQYMKTESLEIQPEIGGLPCR